MHTYVSLATFEMSQVLAQKKKELNTELTSAHGIIHKIVRNPTHKNDQNLLSQNQGFSAQHTARANPQQLWHLGRILRRVSRTPLEHNIRLWSCGEICLVWLTFHGTARDFDRLRTSAADCRGDYDHKQNSKKKDRCKFPPRYCSDPNHPDSTGVRGCVRVAVISLLNWQLGSKIGWNIPPHQSPTIIVTRLLCRAHGEL